MGPFKSEADLHELLFSEAKPYCDSNELAEMRSMMRDDHQIVFSHGDFCFRNIIVDAELGEVRAVLDWEGGGWWPEYWETCKMTGADSNMEYRSLAGLLDDDYRKERNAHGFVFNIL